MEAVKGRWRVRQRVSVGTWHSITSKWQQGATFLRGSLLSKVEIKRPGVQTVKMRLILAAAWLELTRRRLPRRRGLSIAKLLLFVTATLLVDCLPLAQTTGAQAQTSRPKSFLPLEVPLPQSRPDKDGPVGGVVLFDETKLILLAACALGLLGCCLLLFRRPQSHRTTTEPLPRTQAAPRAVGVNLPQPLPKQTVLQGRCWVIDGDTIVINKIRIAACRHRCARTGSPLGSAVEMGHG